MPVAQRHVRWCTREAYSRSKKKCLPMRMRAPRNVYENEVPGKMFNWSFVRFSQVAFFWGAFPSVMQCAGDAGWINASTETKHIAQQPVALCSLGYVVCAGCEITKVEKGRTRAAYAVTVKIYIHWPTSLQPPAELAWNMVNLCIYGSTSR